MSSRIDHVFNEPVIWNSDGPFLPDCDELRSGREWDAFDLHGHVHSRILLDRTECLYDIRGHGVQTADVTRVEDAHRVVVLLRVGCTVRLMFVQCCLYNEVRFIARDQELKPT